MRVRLTDVNDELPVFLNVPRPFLATVATDAPPGTSVYQLLAQDADRDSIVRYTLDSGMYKYKVKGSPPSITERSVPELILGSLVS